MSHDDIVESVAAQPFAADMSRTQVEAVAARAEKLSLVSGDVVFHEGRPARCCYLVVEGLVGLELHVPGRGAVPVTTVGPGELLGWSWLLEPHVWTLDATARATSAVISLDGAALYEACASDPALDRVVSHQIIGALSGRLAATRHQLLDMYGHGSS